MIHPFLKAINLIISVQETAAFTLPVPNTTTRQTVLRKTNNTDPNMAATVPLMISTVAGVLSVVALWVP